jgi:small subunit ribosomal protein S17
MNGTRRKLRVGEVVNDKAEKTVVVAVEWRLRHPLYKKSMRRISKFHVHDEGNECQIGDQVRIMETRPISKSKRWRVVEILKRREMPEAKPWEIGLPVEEEEEIAVPTAVMAVEPELEVDTETVVPVVESPVEEAVEESVEETAPEEEESPTKADESKSTKPRRKKRTKE